MFATYFQKTVPHLPIRTGIVPELCRYPGGNAMEYKIERGTASFSVIVCWKTVVVVCLGIVALKGADGLEQSLLNRLQRDNGKHIVAGYLSACLERDGTAVLV